MNKVLAFKRSEIRRFMTDYHIANIKLGLNGVKISYLDSLKFEYIPYSEFNKRYKRFINDFE